MSESAEQPDLALADEPTRELPVLETRTRIAWKRVGVLAAVTVLSAAGAFAALQDVASRTAPRPPADLTAEEEDSHFGLAAPAGPRLGDLRGLVAYVPVEPMPAPSVAPKASAAPKRARARTTRPSEPGFVTVTGPRPPAFNWGSTRPAPRNCPPTLCD